MLLVTGGSGHIGANLVRRLLDDGEAVRVLVREDSDNAALAGLDVARAVGDLRDPDSVGRAVDGCQRVYHVGAVVETTTRRQQELFETNVLGTRNVLRAALARGVERVVVSGSLSAVGYVPDRPSTEEDPFNPFRAVMPYQFSKAGVEHECLLAVRDGLEVVIATSCAVLGPNDFKPSRMGRVLLDFAAGRMRAYLPGGVEFVGAADVVQGHLLAMAKGRSGHRYILSSEFLTVDQLMALYEQVTGRPRPPFRLPIPLMLAAAHVSHTLLNRLRPDAPQRFTPGAVKILDMHRRACIDRARDELGYTPTPIRGAIQAAYDHFVERGLIDLRGRTAAAAPPATAPAAPGGG